MVAEEEVNVVLVFVKDFENGNVNHAEDETG